MLRGSVFSFGVFVFIFSLFVRFFIVFVVFILLFYFVAGFVYEGRVFDVFLCRYGVGIGVYRFLLYLVVLDVVLVVVVIWS